MMRIGHGYDAHRFQAGSELILGGVKIAYECGIAAHSDGDVVLHALCDALLGAAALGDIGQHFPATAEFENIDSRLLLRRVLQLLQTNQYQLVNADITIVAQAPKLAPYIETMRQNIATDLQVTLQQINVKATTTDGMGFTGRKDGIAAYAVVLLQSFS